MTKKTKDYVSFVEKILKTLALLPNAESRYNKLIFIYYNVNCSIYEKNVAFKLTCDFCEEYCHLHLEDEEICQIITGKKFNVYSSSISINYNNKKKIYIIPKDGITELLNLTPEEIAITEIYKNDEKRARQKAKKEQKIKLLRLERMLRLNGATYEQISEVTGTSTRDIQDDIKSMFLGGNIKRKAKRDKEEAEKDRIEKRQADQLLEEIEKRALSGKNMMISGPAGTGKSSFINALVGKRKTLILSPTNLASSNYEIGFTLHTALRLPLEPVWPESANWHKKWNKDWRSAYETSERFKNIRTIIEEVETIVIDEISCVRFDCFALAMSRIKDIEKDIGRKIQIICIGDWKQLPPVMSESDKSDLSFWWDERWKADKGFAFECEAWDECQFEHIELSYVYRQQDILFKKILKGIRDENYDVAYNNLILLQDDSKKYNMDAIHLCGKNSTVKNINKNIIETRKKEYDDCVVLESKRIAGVKYYKSNYPIELDIEAFPGMFVKMMVTTKDYANGMLAQIVEIHDDYITAKLIGVKEKLVVVKRATIHAKWDEDKATDDETIKPTIEQYPFVMAHAVTVHAAQGQTLKKAYIHTDMFAKNQFYVAVSRVESLDGITIIGDIKRSIFGVNNEKKKEKK